MNKLTVLSEKCIACGKCYLNYPEVFDCDDEGIAFVQTDASEQQQSVADKARFACPTKAIRYIEDASN